MKVVFLTTYSHSTRVVGESNYQEDLQRLIGFIDGDQQPVKEDGFTAELILEDDNPYDRGNAVRVDIDGHTVGYLSRNDAADYRQSLSLLKVGRAVGVCSAIIAGKWNEEVESLLFGVLLDLDPRRLSIQRKIQEAPPPATKQPNVIKSTSQQSTTPKNQSKIPFIPMKGRGCLYFLVVFPFLAIINLYILLFAGIWFGGRWLWKTATATKNSRRISAAFASLMVVCGVIYSSITGDTPDGTSAVPTLDLIAIQSTAIAEAWVAQTQTIAANASDTPMPTVTLPPTETLIPTFTAPPLPTATLITFSTSTPFFLNLPANQPTTAPVGGTCPCNGDTLNCGDFNRQSEAQACFNYCMSIGAGDIHKLDGNNDGAACESLP